MAITVPVYNQRVDLGSAPGNPNVNIRYPSSGIGEALQTSELDHAAQQFRAAELKTAESESLLAATKTHMELEEAFRRDQETAGPGAAQFTPTFMGNVDRATEATAPTLSSEASRKRYRERMAGVALSYEERSLQFEAGERQANRYRSISEAGDNAGNTVYTVDGQNRDLTYKSLQTELFGTLDDPNLGLLPHQRDQLRDEIKNKMAFAGVQADIRDRPDKVQDWLVKGVKSRDGKIDAGTGSDYFSRLRQAESSGPYDQATTSTAFGPYQFTVGAWKDTMKAHPELGMTEADRMKPENQEVMARARTADQAAILKKAGFEPTNTNLYMTWFLGPSGGPRFLNALQANPATPAADTVEPAAVAANPGVFKPGRTVGDVYAIFKKKMEGPGGGPVTAENINQGPVVHATASDAPSYYNDVQITKRDAYYSQAEQELNKRRTLGEAAFKQSVENSISEFASTGVSTKPLTEQEFVAAMGAQRGTVAYGEYQANSQAAGAAFKVQRMPLHEGMQYIETLKPETGDPFYAEKFKGYSAAKEIAQKVQQQAISDFGQHVTNIDPEAKQTLLDAVSNPDPQAARAAADKYASILDTQGIRLGVPASRRSFLPKAYSEEVAAQLNQKFAGDANAEAVVASLNSFKDRWGKNWPQVYSELKSNMSGPVQVITSGIMPKAANILATVHDKSFEDLTKTGSKPDKQTLTDRLQAAFKPFIDSTKWQPSSVPGVMTFYEQARKLAGVYMIQGTSPSSAADAAYNDVLGFKYRMIDTSSANVRVPKPWDDPQMEQALDYSRVKIVEGGIFAPRPEDAKLDPENAQSRVNSYVQRNGSWVTLPDDSGVGFMVAGQLWRDKSGNAVTRGWQQLKDDYKANSKGQRDRAEARGVWGWSAD